MGKELLELFVEKVLEEKESFNILLDEYRIKKSYHFIQANEGKARYIYGTYVYNKEEIYASLTLKPSLVAIVSDEIIYIVDCYMFDIYDKNFMFPQNVRKFTVDDINKYVNDVIFPKFYNELEIDFNTIRRSDENLLKQARKSLLGVDNYKIELEPVISLQDFANHLCGFVNWKELALEKLNENKELYIYKKSLKTKIENLMKEPTTVEEWELKLIDGLRSVDAKTVTVEVELNGKNASSKIEPREIIRTLTNNDTFSSWDFASKKDGERVLNELGAVGELRHSLTCKNITKIMYGKKELYVK